MSRGKGYYSIEQKEYLKDIGKRIKYLRKKYGVSQTELITRIEMSKQGLSKIENGRSDVQIITLYEITKGIVCSMAELFDFEFTYEVQDE